MLKDYDRRYFGAIWDAAYNALEGMEPEPVLDVVADMLFIVNLKNTYWRRMSGPEAEVAEWKVYWTRGWQDRANWPRNAGETQGDQLHRPNLPHRRIQR